MSVAHFDALKTAADGGEIAGRVFDTYREDASATLVRDQYVILYQSVGAPLVERWTLPERMDQTLDLEWDVRAVGATARGAARTLELLLGRLIGTRLTVTGRNCTPLAVGDTPSAVRTDNSGKFPVFYIDASVTCVSRPA